MKKILFLCTCLLSGMLFTGCSEDETPGFGSVYGIVTDSDTHEPVLGATATLSPGNLTTTTGKEGHFEFIDLEPGQYKIQIQASGYQTNSRQIQVNAGVKSTGDMTIKAQTSISGIKLSSETLNFGTNYSELTLSLTNTGTAGTVNWSITNINVNWLSVSPLNGETAMGKSSSIKVMIKRSELPEDNAHTFITLNAAGGSVSIMINATKTSTPGDNPGGDPGDNPGGDPGDNPGDDPVDEDYSSATVTQCDSRIEAAIISCKRSGSSVVFTYTLTNNGLGTVNNFRMYPPSSISLVNGAFRSIITDDQGNEYPYPTMTFRNKSTTGTNAITDSFPEEVACKCTVSIKDVPSTVKKMRVMIGITAYPSSQYNLADNRIYFKNIPIY